MDRFRVVHSCIWFTVGYILRKRMVFYAWDLHTDAGVVLPPASEFVWLDGCICSLLFDFQVQWNGGSGNWTLSLVVARIGKFVRCTLYCTRGYLYGVGYTVVVLDTGFHISECHVCFQGEPLRCDVSTTKATREQI